MSPIYGVPPYDFDRYDDSKEYDHQNNDSNPTDLTRVTFWYMMVLVGMLLLWLLLFFCLRIIGLRQKTRNPQQGRMYVGTRGRPSLGPTEPTIFVSPSNLPPPPKYECMAPPSYEEVVGVHYPNYPGQPITQPITDALAQSTSNSTTISGNRSDSVPETVITVTNETSRTDVTVAARS